jgi:hypothetical protein
MKNRQTTLLKMIAGKTSHILFVYTVLISFKLAANSSKHIVSDL